MRTRGRGGRRQVNLLLLPKIQRVALIIGEHALARAPRRVMHILIENDALSPEIVCRRRDVVR